MRLVLASLLLCAGVATAHADQIASGVVVKVDAREIYVNLGSAQGVADGAPLRLKRPITLRHPVTRAAVDDWLPLGSATVTSAGARLSRAVLDDELRTQLRVGDLVEVYVERDEAPPAPPRPPAPPPPVEPTGPLPAVDPDTASVLQLFGSLTGQPLERRIAAWEGWLSAHEASPHAAAIRADLDALRAQRDAARPRRPTAGSSPIRLEHAGPSRAEPGRALALVFVADDPDRLLSASLHYRVVGATTYARVLLARDHGIYLRGAIPAEAVAAPGVEYFVEATLASGASGAAFASPASPQTIAVARPPVVAQFTGARRRTRLAVMASYQDFGNLDDRAGDRTDRFYAGELDVLYKVNRILYGVRAGYGSFHGEGGYANRTWTERERAPEVGFQYGYAEAELSLPVPDGPPLGLAGRLYAGVGNDGFGLGLAGRVRLGDPDRTNLSAGVTGIQQVGFFSDLRLEARPEARIPVGIAVGVTDQPGGGDLGVRLATDVGWRVTPWLQPTLRVSWQGRTAVHAGLGAGLGLVFDW